MGVRLLSWAYTFQLSTSYTFQIEIDISTVEESFVHAEVVDLQKFKTGFRDISILNPRARAYEETIELYLPRRGSTRARPGGHLPSLMIIVYFAFEHVFDVQKHHISYSSVK